MICCRWLILVCIYASVMFTFLCMKNMVVARFKNCSYDEGEDYSGYESFVLSFRSGGG